MPTTSPELALNSARILAHAVGDDAPFLRGGGHHAPAGAHAEAVDGAAVAAVMREAVGGRAQDRVARATAEARADRPRLRMLDPHADGERLGLDMHAAPVQHLEGRARAVADGEDDMIGLEESLPSCRCRPAQSAFAVRPVRSSSISSTRVCRSDIRRPAPRSSRACSRPSSRGGRCRYADAPPTGCRPARRPRRTPPAPCAPGSAGP
jgi:hypothetical protein